MITEFHIEYFIFQFLILWYKWYLKMKNKRRSFSLQFYFLRKNETKDMNIFCRSFQTKVKNVFDSERMLVDVLHVSKKLQSYMSFSNYTIKLSLRLNCARYDNFFIYNTAIKFHIRAHT